MSAKWTIKSAAEAIKRRELKAVDLLGEYLEVAQKNNEQFQACVRFLEDEALVEAKSIDSRLDAGEDVGPLAGIPVVIKDNMNLEGVPITAGSKILEGYRSPFTATAVERLRAAGAVIIGITNMDEFAMGSSTENSAMFPTRNPRNPEYVPGGSSGGSAAAVAADMALGSLGSDTGGSIRLPASFCGVVGLKPTYGRVSRYGLIAYASSLDQIGPFAKTVEDVALLYNAIAGFDENDSTSLNNEAADPVPSLDRSLAGVKVGVPREFFGDGFHDGIRRDILASITDLAKLGAEIKEISLPSLEYALAAYYLIACAEASSNLQRFEGVRFGRRDINSSTVHEMMTRTRAEGFGTEVQRRILLGTYILSAGYYEAYYLKAQKVRTLIKNDFTKAFSDVDIIAGPVSPVPPFKLGEKLDDPLAMYLTDVATVSANLVGLPALSIPCGDVDGLPTGLQLMARHLDEELLLNVAHQYEQQRDAAKDSDAGPASEPFQVDARTLNSLTRSTKPNRAEIPIERIAQLACLEPHASDTESILSDISEIIGYVDLLGDVETDDVEPTIHPFPSEQVLREGDEALRRSSEIILENAPEREGSAFKIPNII